VIAPASVLLACASAPSAEAASIFAGVPLGDQILGGQLVGTNFNIGFAGTAGGVNNWPGAESPDHVIDNVNFKYLNFAETNTGFLVNPVFNGGNGSVVTSMQLWVANDAADRDPASYTVYGTNTAQNFANTVFDVTQFSQISTGTLALPAARPGTGNDASPLNNAFSQTVNFANSTAYKYYLVIFPTVRNGAGANSMQIGEVQFFGTATFQNLIWSGANSSVWDTGVVQNFTLNGNPSTYTDGNGATFDDTANPARTNINVPSPIAPAAVVFNNNTLNYTLGGAAINSVGTLTLNGTASVTLNNAASFASSIVNAGTLTVGPSGTLGSGLLSVNNPNTGAGSAVTVNFNSAQSIGSLSGTLAAPSSGTNSATINLNGLLTVNQTTDETFAGSIAGPGSLTKNGNRVLTLTGSSTYTGPTIINAGTLASSLPGDNPKGALPAGQPVTVNTGATLRLGADDGLGYYAGSVSSLTVNGGTVTAVANTHSTLPAVTMTGGTLNATGAGNILGPAAVNYILDGDVTTVAGAAQATISAPAIRLRKDPGNTGTSSSVIFNVPRGTAPVDLSISSVIQDLGAGLTKSGNGILSLASGNTYTGPTNINAGKVIIKDSASLGTGVVTLANGTTLSLNPTGTFNGFNNFTLNGGPTLDAGKTTVTLTTGVNNQTRSIFSNAPVSIGSGFTATFDYTASGAADGITFTIQNNSPTALGAGGGGLGYMGMPNSAALEFNIYTGANPAQPIGTNFATGGVTGTYISSSPVNLASGLPTTVTVTYDPLTQTLMESLVSGVNNYSNTFFGVNLPAALGGTVGYFGFTGATGGAASTQTVGNFTFTSTAALHLANNVTLPAGATSTMEITQAASGGSGAASVQGTLTLNPNATLNVTGDATPTNLPYLLEMNGITSIGANVTISVANNGTGLGTVTMLDITGQSPTSGLTKIGPGTLTFLGVESYTGPTSVNAGMLVVVGSLSGSATTVNTGGTLAGTGTLGAVTVAGGGTLSPGIGGIGTINTGLLLLQNSSTFSLEIGASTADQIKVAGAGTLAGTIPLPITLTADPVDNTVFTILDGTAALVGYVGGARFSFLGNSLDQGEQFNVANGGFSQDFVISYSADAGRDVTLTAVVPEPGSLAAILAGTATLLGLRRRRRE
jgi:autotransporter-associated beta strand protein